MYLAPAALPVYNKHKGKSILGSIGATYQKKHNNPSAFWHVILFLSIQIIKIMANTFSQIYLQFVFAVKFRQSLIPKKHKEELHKYFTGLVQNRQAKMLAVNSMPDHIHLFVGFKPSVLISDFVKEIKVEINEFINDNKWVPGNFAWQNGYGVFSYGHSQINHVCKYIFNQEKHHEKKTFKQEYLEMLERFEIDFDEKYLFDFLD